MTVENFEVTQSVGGHDGDRPEPLQLDDNSSASGAPSLDEGPLRRSFADLSTCSSPRRIGTSGRLGPMAQLELGTQNDNGSALLSPGERTTSVVDSRMDVLRRKAQSSVVPPVSPGGRSRSRAEAGKIERVVPVQPEQIEYTAEALSSLGSFAALTTESEKKKGGVHLPHLKKKNKVSWRLSFWSLYEPQKCSAEIRKMLQKSFMLAPKSKKGETEIEVDTQDKRLKNCHVHLRFEAGESFTEIVFELKTEPTDAAAQAFGKFFEDCKRTFASTGLRAVRLHPNPRPV
mmetsp:Transcript_20938/g.51174  ORF Transcript_20938/g.51174 Transcript_20938/m.51174 type:complete len:288 (+) Transcript_20938:103-966(+)